MNAILEARRPRLLLILFCLVAWLPGFFTLPPSDRDESRFAQATKQMVETGDYVRILNGTEERNRKPIGIHWLQAPFVAAARATGLAGPTAIWPYRVPSLLGGLIAVLGTYTIGLLLFERRAAMAAALFLGASVILTVETHIAKTDAALLASVVLAQAVLAVAHRFGRLNNALAALFWLALAAGVLLKGPIAPMVVGLTVLTLVIVERRGRWLRALRPAWGLPLMLLAILPWFVAIGLATHGRFFTQAVGGDLGRKIISGDDGHWAPPGAHLVMLPLLILPATAALGGALRRAWRDRGEPVTRFLLCWIVPSWLVFEAAPTKLPHYPLPLYPALCLLLAAWLVREDRRPIGRLFAGLSMVASVGLGLALALAPILLHWPIWFGLPSLAAALWIARQYLPLLARASPARHALEIRSLLAATLAMPVLYWAALAIELPHLDPIWIGPRVVAFEPPRPLGSVGYNEPSLMFLAGTDTLWLQAAAGAQALAQGRIGSLLVADRDLATVQAALSKLGAQTRTIATVRGFNYSRGRFVTLTLLVLQKLGSG